MRLKSSSGSWLVPASPAEAETLEVQEAADALQEQTGLFASLKRRH